MPGINLYLDQLIKDIREAAKDAPEDKTQDEALSEEESFRKHIESVEEYIYGDPVKISTVTGIEKKSLPRPGQLNDKQKAKLAAELESLLNHYHFFPDFPQNYPDHLKYKFLRDTWDDKHQYITSGESHIEFCEYDPDNCPFPGYCNTCEEIEKDFNKNEEAKYIPSIFNYCDRWCERCDFTDRCRNYSTQEDLIERTSNPADEMKRFQEQVAKDSDTVKESTTLPSDEIVPNGKLGNSRIDFNEREDKISIVKEAQNYSFRIHDWLLKHNNYFESKEPVWETEGKLEENREALMVIGYYSLFISAKIRRASSGLLPDEFSDEDDEDVASVNEYDMNGSAKIALISIDRSIEALQTLKNNLHDFKTRISDFTEMLTDLRKNAEETFPDARAIVRPGFDE